MAGDFVLASESEVREATPMFGAFPPLPRGAIIAAPGDEVDLVSRFFAPGVGIQEDPVTGSAHAQLVPLWAERIGSPLVIARQLSRRGGALRCELAGDRVLLAVVGLAVVRLAEAGQSVIRQSRPMPPRGRWTDFQENSMATSTIGKPAAADADFTKIDANKDGSLSRDEIHAWRSAQRATATAPVKP